MNNIYWNSILKSEGLGMDRGRNCALETVVDVRRMENHALGRNLFQEKENLYDQMDAEVI